MKPLQGEIRVPGDKSIAHRACLVAALAEGDSHIIGFSGGGDNHSTLRVLRGLGVHIEVDAARGVRIQGRGLRGLSAPVDALDCGNSGTTMRLMMGLLAGQRGAFELVGDASLSARPMERVAAPLRRLGARIEMPAGDHPPVRVVGAPLVGSRVETRVASAQVKSACLLAALLASGETTVFEATPTRDHTERMLRHVGVTLHESSVGLRLLPPERLEAGEFVVPGDVSSAAFFAGAAALVPGSEVVVRGVGLNPRRVGFLHALREMGASVEWVLTPGLAAHDEPVGDLVVRGPATLRGVDISPERVADMVDELPLFACLAAVADGPSVVVGADELRVKETDRISATGALLRALGATVEDTRDGWRFAGNARLTGGAVRVEGDHRLAMCAAVLSRTVTRGPVEIDAPSVASVSFPGFFETLERLG